jgi:Ner family transcriptional regulator
MAKNIARSTVEIPPPDVLTDDALRRTWVTYRLQRLSKTLADVAEAAGVKQNTIYHAFLRPYPRIEQHIAEAVGLQPHQLFPERYDALGNPAKRGPRIKSFCHRNGKDTGIQSARNLQDKRAA